MSEESEDAKDAKVWDEVVKVVDARLTAAKADVDGLVGKIEAQGRDLRTDAREQAADGRRAIGALREHVDGKFEALGGLFHKLELGVGRRAAVEEAAGAGWAAVLRSMEKLGEYGQRIHDLEERRVTDLAALRAEMKADREAGAAARKASDGKLSMLTRAVWAVGSLVGLAALRVLLAPLFP